MAGFRNFSILQSIKSSSGDQPDTFSVGTRVLWGISMLGIPCRGPSRRASLLGTPKDILRKAWKWASASLGAPLLGKVEGCFFLRAFLSRGIFVRFLRDIHLPCKWVSLSIGTLMGNLEGGGGFNCRDF